MEPSNLLGQYTLDVIFCLIKVVTRVLSIYNEPLAVLETNGRGHAASYYLHGVTTLLQCQWSRTNRGI